MTLASGLAVAVTGGTLVAATAAGSNPGPSVYAGPVHISPTCTNGVYSEYCGNEQNWGDELGFYVGSSSWFVFAYKGEHAHKVFESAPGGVASNQCLTDTGSRLYLSRCTGAESQLFEAQEISEEHFAWQNAATGLYIQDNGKYKPLTAKPADEEANQEWHFITH